VHECFVKIVTPRCCRAGIHHSRAAFFAWSGRYSSPLFRGPLVSTASRKGKHAQANSSNKEALCIMRTGDMDSFRCRRRFGWPGAQSRVFGVGKRAFQEFHHRIRFRSCNGGRGAGGKGCGFGPMKWTPRSYQNQGTKRLDRKKGNSGFPWPRGGYARGFALREH